MTKRVVIRVAARGYVDGRYIGEEKEVIEAIDPSGRGRKKRGQQGKAGKTANTARGARGGKGGNAQGNADARGNRARGEGRGGKRARGVGGDAFGNTTGTPSAANAANKRPRGRRGAATSASEFNATGADKRQRGRKQNRIESGQGSSNLPMDYGNALPSANANTNRRNRGGKKTPFRTPNANAKRGKSLESTRLISEVAEARRWGDESKSGQFAEALAREANVKRERLHKVLAQSGQGSRRDMEIMISSGRVMVNGIVATTGMSVSANDVVMIDHKPVKLKFNEELPRVLLYHKPDGEIVTTNDPGNRITVFDNLPPVETGKWMSIGRLDINTSGLLIFTTSGELANRLMHPRYEVEREYAVRVLGELTDEQTEQLLAGVSIATEGDDDDIDEPDDRPAKFDTIEKRGGEGANQWYHVVLREGRNREVRKMFEAVGLTVSRLIRVRFGKIGLPPRLTRGRMLELDAAQVRSVLKWVGMDVEGRMAPLPSNHQPNRGKSSNASRVTAASDEFTGDVVATGSAAISENGEGSGVLHAEGVSNDRRSLLRGRRGKQRKGAREMFTDRATKEASPQTAETTFIPVADMAAADAAQLSGDAPNADAPTVREVRENTRGPRRGRNLRRNRTRDSRDPRGARDERGVRPEGTQQPDGNFNNESAGASVTGIAADSTLVNSNSNSNALAVNRESNRSRPPRPPREGRSPRPPRQHKGQRDRSNKNRNPNVANQSRGNTDDNIGNRARESSYDEIDDNIGNR
jgi:23S rRNA pseudouridine2605 synthase